MGREGDGDDANKLTEVIAGRGTAGDTKLITPGTEKLSSTTSLIADEGDAEPLDRDDPYENAAIGGLGGRTSAPPNDTTVIVGGPEEPPAADPRATTALVGSPATTTLEPGIAAMASPDAPSPGSSARTRVLGPVHERKPSQPSPRHSIESISPVEEGRSARARAPKALTGLLRNTQLISLSPLANGLTVLFLLGAILVALGSLLLRN